MSNRRARWNVAWTRGAVLAAAVLLMAASYARADMVLDWNAIMASTVTGPPFETSRVTAITQLAVFEAVNAITGEYAPYLGTLVAPVGASAESAAAAAAHAVLKHYYPAKASALDAALASSLNAIADGSGKAAGIAVGESAAAEMIALREGDGSAFPEFYVAASTEAGQWQPTPSCSALGGVYAHWRNVTPFGIESGDQFRAAPPPQLTSGEYSKDYAEVQAVGASDSDARPDDRALVARFYATLSPVTWPNAAARQIAGAQGRSLSDNAHALALLNMALSDAAVAVFDSKYHYTAWRPETAIQGGDIDDNPRTETDGFFLPYITAPCFPGYPSNHGTVSGAAREVLERLYGSNGHDISLSTPGVPGVVLHYSSFKDITADVDDARVYGGIHFRFDQEAGGRQGQQVGAYVFKHNLQPVHPE
jgi:hypothetical protein